MVKPVDCATKKQLKTLWIHESMRVFHDRLVDNIDKKHFLNILYELLKRSFEETSSYEDVFDNQIIMYADYLRPGYARDDRRYEQVIKIYSIYDSEAYILNFKSLLLTRILI